MSRQRCFAQTGLFVISLLPLLLFSGCKVGPDYEVPEASVPDQWHEKAVQGLENGSANLQTWWTVFGDEMLNNLITNMETKGFAPHLRWLDLRAGYTISESVIPYTPDDTYARALLVGILNTLMVSVVGIFLATIIGLIVGLILGLFLGMALFWGLFPVDWEDADTYHLAPPARAKYVALVADSFRLDKDPARVDAYLLGWTLEEKQIAMADAGAAYENVLTGLLHVQSHVNIVWGIGNLESTKCMSLEMAVIGNDMIVVT